MQYNLLGIIFILYGVIKLGLILAIIFIPPTIREKLSYIEGFDLFISNDSTLAGKMYEYVLFVFAVFSIIHGLALLGTFNESFHTFIESKPVQYSFYILLGLWLFIFYFLVIYTNVPIEKRKDNMYNYKIYGYLGGLSFILVPPIWILMEYFNPYLSRMKEEQQLMYMTFIMLGAVFLIFLTYIVLKRLRKMKKEHEEQNAQNNEK
jgi:preprotein translocase subunit YajC